MIAIGIPTVIHAATIVNDTMNGMIRILSDIPMIKENGAMEVLEAFDNNDKYRLIREILEPQLGDMFVTPKDIDESIKTMAEIVAYGINLIFSIN